jgi:hypothetical protein
MGEREKRKKREGERGGGREREREGEQKGGRERERARGKYDSFVMLGEGKSWNKGTRNGDIERCEGRRK